MHPDANLRILSKGRTISFVPFAVISRLVCTKACLWVMQAALQKRKSQHRQPEDDARASIHTTVKAPPTPGLQSLPPSQHLTFQQLKPINLCHPDKVWISIEKLTDKQCERRRGISCTFTNQISTKPSQIASQSRMPLRGCPKHVHLSFRLVTMISHSGNKRSMVTF